MERDDAVTGDTNNGLCVTITVPFFDVPVQVFMYVRVLVLRVKMLFK
jgi:hypothetical protein